MFNGSSESSLSAGLNYAKIASLAIRLTSTYLLNSQFFLMMHLFRSWRANNFYCAENYFGEPLTISLILSTIYFLTLLGTHSFLLGSRIQVTISDSFLKRSGVFALMQLSIKVFIFSCVKVDSSLTLDRELSFRAYFYLSILIFIYNQQIKN